MLKAVATLPWRKLRALIDAQFPAEPVGLFRALTACVVLADVLASWKLAPLLWGTWRDIGLIDAAYGAWVVVLVCLIAGYRTTFMAVANAVFCYLLIFRITHVFEYHFDYYARTWALYLVFMQSGRAYSIDSLLARVRADRLGEPPPPRVVPLFVIALFFVQFSLDYFDAGYRKWTDHEMWPEGFGLYWPMVSRFCSTGDGLWMLNHPWLLELGSRGAVFLELTFPLLMLWKPTRIAAVVGGVVLHIGIIHVFPIPYFGELMLAIYFIFIPASWLRRVEVRLAGRTRPISEWLWRRVGRAPPPRADPDARPPPIPRWRGRARLVAFVVVSGLLVFIKLGHINKAPAIKKLDTVARTLTGFVPHDVFLSKHFRNNGVLELELERFDGSRVRYPLIAADGYPGALLQSSTRVWAMMSRVSFRRKPMGFLRRHFLPWLDATNPDACAVYIYQRWVKAPRDFAGPIDVWTNARRTSHGRYAFRRTGRRKKRCARPPT